MSKLTYKETQKIRRNVKRGAKILDKKYRKLTGSETPWYKVVDMAELQFCNNFKCVYGQLFDSCDNGLTKLGISAEADSGYKYGVCNSDYACDLDDNSALSTAELEKMVEFWFEEILTRRRATA